MNCKDINVLINNFLDGSLTELEALQFESHIETCVECRLEFEEIKFIHEIMADSELSSLPENFEEELREKLESVNIEVNDEDLKGSTVVLEKQSSKTSKVKSTKKEKSKLIDFNAFKESRSIAFVKKHRRMITSVAAVFMIGVFTLGSMDSIPSYRFGSDESYVTSDMVYDEVAEEMSMEAPSVMSTMAVESNGNLKQDRGNVSVTFNEELSSPEAEYGDGKANYALSTSDDNAGVNYKEDRLIIKNGYASIEVLDFDKTMSDIKAFVNSNGGYVSDLSSSKYGDYNEDKDRYYKSGYVNVRIPKRLFDQMFSEISSYGNVESTSISTNDITDSYRGISDEVINLEIREKKLREIMEKTVEITDVIEVERELSRVRGEINRLSGTLQNWESLVELSSINIQIIEVKTLNKYIKPVDATLLEQAKYALIRSLNDLVLFVERFVVAFIGNLPNFIIIGVLALIGRFVYRRRLK